MLRKITPALFRGAATALAAGVALTGTLAVTPAAQAATVTAAQLAGNTPLATVSIGPNYNVYPKWRNIVASAGSQVQEAWAHSPSMNRDIPLVIIRPADNSKPRPIVYLLNGGDGGEGSANWIMQTDVINFYRDKNVNVVIPMSGAFSYYSDWVSENPSLGGKQMWETFLTRELPVPLQQTLGATEQRAILGMSMTATTTLLYAQHYPGFYDMVGSFSGCAQTNTGLGAFAAELTLNRGDANLQQMWGPTNSPTRLYNDALINAEKLRGQRMYISNGTGLAGINDLWTTEWTGGDSSNVAIHVVNGGVIEAATATCTHDLKAKLDHAGIGADWNLRTTGTHSWGYWQDDLRGSWPVIATAFGM